MSNVAIWGMADARERCVRSFGSGTNATGERRTTVSRASRMRWEGAIEFPARIAIYRPL